ncbi:MULTISPECIES: TetR/AcrR family transcriptional regulator [unclassified Janthinobacterium]|uniref:TetR/AcrR family transcriptional regulator n=1 Tax=unclassified Janthinobacterium TaxID=2610881 RepID=UPI00161AEA7F|nr:MULTISPECIES: TetR/AcrR family transcriptional regulator [unclassified Janthinobacterium]MBB5370056.1 AcrR family transcriptional regulator [Janthinobacterium sp. K2C7]MBB5382862.1 AcrR family transcriptional regulator [Janthinobacterium sp. K2Li3]MBB5384847.1 AcrR family transcriptional regulator [Janthinobacterium sp. K2E3]
MAQMGRPRTFDRQAAIEQAMHLFWEQGYESTSLSQLKAGIGGGISAPSFYAAFGSKEALFREAVQRYLDTYARVTECLWDDTLAPRAAVELALRQSTKMQCEQGHPKGCMVALGTMSAPTPEHAAVAEPLAQSRARSRAGFVHCVERGIASGELTAAADPHFVAAIFDGFLLGVSIQARDGVAYPVLDAAIKQLMVVWDTNLAHTKSNSASA